jgi:hypothetical protein
MIYLGIVFKLKILPLFELFIIEFVFVIDNGSVDGGVDCIFGRDSEYSFGSS